jgi:hypothetical protein
MDAKHTKGDGKTMNKMLVILGSLLLVLVLVGVGFFMLNQNDTPDEDTENTFIQIKKVSGDEIGLTMELISKPNGDYVLFDVTKLEGIDRIEGSLDYEAVSKGIQGVLVDVNIASGTYTLPKEIYLGTCSAQCTPHELTTDIKAILKITFSNGEIGEVTEVLVVEDKSTESSEVPASLLD